MAEIERREITVAWGGVRLAGTLHLPTSLPPHPAVLMMQGSGPADRDSGGYFPPIRDAFLSRGIAVYSFDKPGIGGSSGDWRRYGLADRTEQALAAITLLREQEGIDPRRVGIWGHSQGGWLVQMLAARLSDLAFAIANSGPAIGVEQQDRYGCEHTM
ncbi:MAG: alpha/beta hydrolase family protein, partial [Thermomicrobiales bacterium]